ncbi:hypothetical protein L4D06_23320 [Enterovibrio makurazakiensis]|uniref:hypothetical protein n=1 Tax=Enterovibrio makurazakiensis TaxID=2910232 RepID=UPI003D23C895
MSSFYYKESARKNAREGFLVWLLCVPICVVILIVFRETHPTMVMLVSSLVVFVSLFSLFIIYKASRSQGDWVISITDSAFIWETPKKRSLLGEHSFQYDLCEIEKITGVEVHRFDGTQINYFLYLKSGNKLSLMTGSNVPMIELIEVLKSKGLKYEHSKA